MTREELIKAMDDSKEVQWKNDAYKCFKDKFGRYLVKCTLNDYIIGIFHQNGIGMNLDPEDCYIKNSEPEEIYGCAITEWEHGETHSHIVDKLTIGELLGDEWENLIPSDLIDNLRGHLLDSIAIRKKLRPNPTLGISNPLTDEKLSNLLTEEVCDYWLGDATNKQARINLFYECKNNLRVLESVLDHWRGVDQ